jgi:hypothetical protein
MLREGRSHQEKINELLAAVLELRAPMQNPPDGTDAVVDQLRKAGRLAKRLAETNDILGFFPDLRTVASDGYDAIKAMREALPSNDPFAFLDDEAKPPKAKAPALATTEDVSFIDRLLAGPDDAELTPRELALLEAHLKQPIDSATVQQERREHLKGESETWNCHSKLKLMRDFNRNLQRATVEGDAGDDQQEDSASSSTAQKKTKTKKSTVRGEGDIKIVSALTKHHQYADGGCLNLTPIGHRKIAPAPVPDEVREAYRNVARELSNVKQEHVLRLSDDADAALQVWEVEIERMLADGGNMEIMRDWGAKLAGATLRLAAVLHCIEYGPSGRIDRPALVAAIRIARYLIPHAEAVLNMMQAKEDKTNEDARYVLRWIERHGKREFTKSEAQHHGKRRFPKADDIDAALAELELRAYIRRRPKVTTGAGRPPSPSYEVNPAVFSKSERDERSHNSRNSDEPDSDGNSGNIGSALEASENSERVQVTI